MRTSRFLLLFALAAIFPTLSTLIHGVAASEPVTAPTAVHEIRQNEGVASKTADEVIQREEEAINPDGFSVKELKLMESVAEKHQFQAEVNRLMQIIINSLYSNSEIFLRELISNGSDALDKIRFLALTDPKQLESGQTLEIKIRGDSKAKTLTITDTGIGMTRENLINNLGTIAKSGTLEFMEKFKQGDNVNLIGQFGVGFYSAFLVADEVTVITKHNEDSKQWVWRSDSQGQYTITEDPRGVTLGRGTQIVLHLKEDALEFANQDTLRALVKKYSEFINFPIYLWASSEESKDVPLTEEEIEAELAKKKEDDTEDVNLDGEPTKADIPTTKTVTQTVWGWDLMNQHKPIWTRNPKEITEEEYNDFFKALTKETQDPLAHIHFSGEGDVDFRSILYIPANPPSNYFNADTLDDFRGIKLYVKRVFITDEFKDILPKYLTFIRGMVDSDDLPLNVSREMLQEHKILSMIKKKLIRKAIAMFQEMQEADAEKYKKFHKNFGTNLKLGIIEDSANRARLSKLVMFHSSTTDELTTLSDYVSRMKEGQEQIYYLAGESKEAVASSPLIERLVKKGYEVLFMIDPIDEYALGHMEKFDSKYKLTNVAREGVTFDGEEDDAESEQDLKDEFKDVINFLKTKLADKIERVQISKLLSNSPSALVSSMYGFTANMERIVKAQALGDKSVPNWNPKKIMEINPRHPIVKELNRRVASDPTDATANDIAKLMYDTAALASGFSLEDPAEFSQRIVRMMNLSLDLDASAAPEPEAEPVKKKSSDSEHVNLDKDEL